MATGLLNDGINVMDEFAALAPNPADYEEHEPGDPAAATPSEGVDPVTGGIVSEGHVLPGDGTVPAPGEEKELPYTDAPAPGEEKPVVAGAELPETDSPSPEPEPVHDPTIDVGGSTVAAVKDHLDAHPEELDAVKAAELAGRARKTLLSDLEYRAAQRDSAVAQEGTAETSTTEQPAGDGAEAATTKES